MPDQRSGQVIDFFDGVAIFDRVSRAVAARHADKSVGDEVRCILADHDTFAEYARGKIDYCRHHVRIGALSGDNFEQLEMARRVEEVRAQEMSLEILAPS